jgi:RNA polymerase sigma-70 factor (ECF subfamily)
MSPAEKTHEDLLEAIAISRDKAAFADLFSHFAPRLKSYLLRLGTDAPMAEEVAQEAMVMIWRKAESFDRSQASAATWIFTIARNKRIDRLRRERRPELDPDDPALIPNAPEAADKTIEAQQAETSLRLAIEKLPKDQSDLIRAAYFEDKTHREIADERGIPLGTVKSRIRLALARLRQEIDDFDHDPNPPSAPPSS